MSLMSDQLCTLDEEENRKHHCFLRSVGFAARTSNKEVVTRGIIDSCLDAEHLHLSALASKRHEVPGSSSTSRSFSSAADTRPCEKRPWQRRRPSRHHGTGVKHRHPRPKAPQAKPIVSSVSHQIMFFFQKYDINWKIKLDIPSQLTSMASK